MNTEHIHVYTQMKMILALLTNVDASDTKKIMDVKLSEQVIKGVSRCDGRPGLLGFVSEVTLCDRFAFLNLL